MTAITAKPRKFNHTGVMQRVIDEAEYVLTVLQHMRKEACCNPKLLDPDAQKQIDQASARVEEVLREARTARANQKSCLTRI